MFVYISKVFNIVLTSFGFWLILGCEHTTLKPQPKLGAKVIEIIQHEGLKFKDLNRNKKLDPYEDWRLSADLRAENLLGQMNLEQKIGFMLISTIRMENEAGFGQPSKDALPISDGLAEVDVESDMNFFTRVPLDDPFLSSAATTKSVAQFHGRHFILRANAEVDIMASWQNNLQALCAAQPLGIPAIVASNPRNHVTTDASVGLSLGKTAFSQWPGELGLSASRDLHLIKQFADIARQEWRAVGLRKGYMYMADLSTEPRWQRIEGTFGEDPIWVAQIMTALVKGFQGDQLGPESVALTTKHFPGGGATEGGQDPHFKWGRREVFDGGAFQKHLIPFKAAIAAGTSAIMPYYSFPVHTPYDTLGYAFNKPVLTDLLRNELGFQGIINSDTGPIRMMPWGVENLTVRERYKLALEAGVNLFSGSADPEQLLATVEENPQLMPLIHDSVKRLLIEKFQLGLFENPYVDVAQAKQIVGQEAFVEAAHEAHRKSIVLLRNETHQERALLPLQKKTKVYVEVGEKPLRETFSSDYIDLVNSPEAADVILFWVLPKGKSLFQSNGQPISLRLSDNKVNVKRIQELSAKKPTLLAINYTNPWVIDEIYAATNPNVKGVLATFGTTIETLMEVITGTVNPVGKMPFSTPLSATAVAQQKPDIPGFEENQNYALFHYDEGLNY
ncbi:MAG: glycoside hydrolase family 3 N-terminal domain-containing protein [Flavobacteriaceae bacterium]